MPTDRERSGDPPDRRRQRTPPAAPASILPVPGLPCASEAYPKREENQTYVEAERSATDVEPVGAELRTPRNVAGREDLRDAGEPWTHQDSIRVPWHRFERHRASAFHFDLAGTQRPRSDETHVTTKNVPGLRQFVHRGRTHHAPHACHPAVPLARLQGPGQALGVNPHRSEFQRAKHAAILADSIL